MNHRRWNLHYIIVSGCLWVKKFQYSLIFLSTSPRNSSLTRSEHLFAFTGNLLKWFGNLLERDVYREPSQRVCFTNSEPLPRSICVMLFIPVLCIFYFAKERFKVLSFDTVFVRMLILHKTILHIKFSSKYANLNMTMLYIFMKRLFWKVWRHRRL